MDLDAVYSEALAIRDAAASEERDLTAAEVARLDVLLAQLNSGAQLARLAQMEQPRGRLTSPDTPGHRMAAHTPSAGSRRHTSGQQLVDLRTGTPLPVLAAADRLVDQLPRNEHAAPNDLAAFIYGAASGDWSRLSDGVRAQMGGAPDSAGGYLLPSPLSAQVFDLLRDASVFMRCPGVQTVIMSTRQLDFATVDDSVVPEWRAEHAPIGEDVLTLGRVSLEAKSLGAMIRVSEELLDDAPNSSSLIRAQLAAEMAQSLDSALFLGAGGLAPTGLVSQANVVTVPNIGTPSSYGFLMAALGALWQRNVNPTALVMSPNTRITLGSLPTGISSDNTQLMPPRELNDLVWLLTNKMGGTGSPQTSTAIMGDWSGAVVGMRQQMRIEVSNTGGSYVSDSPPVTGDSFSRVQIRVRASLRADLALAEPLKFQVLTDIED